MLSLKDFNATKLSDTNQRNVKGGGHDTKGGEYFFGKGNSVCDWEEAPCQTYWYFEGGDIIRGSRD